jgi:BirA family transcriptional regulator, biotin operon repressor / biotin---[acetyl-CoA-carboxylase] ligase
MQPERQRAVMLPERQRGAVPRCTEERRSLRLSDEGNAAPKGAPEASEGRKNSLRLSDEGNAAPKSAPEASEGRKHSAPEASEGRRNSLSVPALLETVRARGGQWRDIRVVAETGSTNADLLAEAADGTPEGAVLVAEAQSAGRGRIGRSWVSPPRAGLTFSVLLRPGLVPAAARSWVPLLAGVALASSLQADAAVDARLKWPNDVLVGGAKLAGILAERTGDAIVVGVGVNVSAGRDELPVTGATSLPATSLALAGAACLDRQRLLAGMLAELERWYLAWAGKAGDAEASGLREAYQRLSDTLGRQVRVLVPGDRTVTGVATDLDESGRLVVRSAGGPVAVSAGEVIHVR